MLRKIIVILIILMPMGSMAQSAYDSLRRAYSPADVVTRRNELNISFTQYVNQELTKITNPEIRQLATCAFAENLYGYAFISDDELLNMVNNILKNPINETVQAKAKEVKSELLRSLINTTVKPLAFPTAKGDTITLVDLYSSGKDYVVIDFWATWCGPCIASMRKFNALKEKYNIEIYSVSIDDTIEKFQKFVSKNPTYTWPIVYGGKGAGLHEYFKIRSIPAYFIVDKNGLIVSSSVGNELERELKKLYKK